MTRKKIEREDITEWLSNLKVNYSRYTYKAYKSALKHFLKWMKNRLGKVVYPDWKILQLYLNYLASSGYSEMTRHTYFHAIRSFLVFNDREDIIREFKRKGRPPRSGVFRTTILTDREIKKLLDAARKLKERLMVKLMYLCGLRVSELISLLEEDVDLENGYLKIRVKKKRRQYISTHALDSETIEMLEAWLEEKPKSKWLFPSPKNPSKPMTPRAVELMIKRLAERAGIEKNISPHTLRHSIASKLAKMGIPAQEIAVYIRDTLKAVERYIHLRPEAVTENIVRKLFEQE